MRKLVVATTNAHKLEEIAKIASEFGYEAVSRADAGVPDFEVEESGATYEENALLKAKAVFDFLGGKEAVVADDSGLSVDALDGGPGLYSARFVPDGTDSEHNEKILELLEDVPEDKRTARYVCAIALLEPGFEPLICRGEVEGQIAFQEDGNNGFGYDPLFIPLESEREVLSAESRERLIGQTFGRFLPEEKNKISHRGRALAKLREGVLARAKGN